MSKETEVLDGDKANNEVNKAHRNAQAVGNVRLSERTEYTIKADTRHLKKGEKVRLCAPTAALFKSKGLI